MGQHIPPLPSALPFLPLTFGIISILLNCSSGKRNSRALLSAEKFFNWLDILFPDFLRDQIRAAGEITSRIQLTLKYLSLVWENREREGGKTPFSCTSSRGPLFNCIIVNEVLMQLQERGPVSLPSHESHVSSSPDWGHEITEHSFYRCSSCFQTHVSLHQPPSCHMSGKSSELSSVCVCAGEFEMQWLFVYFGVGGAAEELGGLFIIPLTSWIRAGIIIRSMNIHEWRIWERVRERLTGRNRQTGRATRTHISTHTHRQSYTQE